MTETEKQIFLVHKKKLYEYLKRTVDLVDFIDREAGVSFKKNGSRYKTLCPFHFHREKTPSFICSLGRMGGWRFKCFGCGTGGSIIDFCMNFFSISNPEEALLFLVDRLNLKDNTDWLNRAITTTQVRVDKVHRVEFVHFTACNRCRILLRKFSGNREIGKWVGVQYKNMNRIMSKLDEENVDERRAELEKISSIACRISENGVVP